MYDTIGIDLETGEWQKIHFNYDRNGDRLDVEAATRTWTDFSGIREGSSSEWLAFSQKMWDNVLTMTGVADIKNIGTFGLLTCTGVLLASSRYAIISHIRSGYGFDVDTHLPTNYIDTISRLQIEGVNAMAAKNAEKLQGARLLASKYGSRSASQKWSEIVKYIGTPRGVRPSDVTWFTHGSWFENGAPLVPGNTGAKMLFKGDAMRLYTQGFTGAEIVATDVQVANEPVAGPVAGLPGVEARPAIAVVPRPAVKKYRGGRIRWWRF